MKVSFLYFGIKKYGTDFVFASNKLPYLVLLLNELRSVKSFLFWKAAQDPWTFLSFLIFAIFILEPISPWLFKRVTRLFNSYGQTIIVRSYDIGLHTPFTFIKWNCNIKSNVLIFEYLHFIISFCKFPQPKVTPSLNQSYPTLKTSILASHNYILKIMY